MNKFGERLKELRLEEGISQEELARRVDISHSAIAFWEKNEREPKLGAVITLAQYFKVSLDYIVGLED